MPYSEHYLLSFGGDMCAGQEVWANNIRMAVPGADLTIDDIDPETQLVGFAQDIRLLAADINARWSPDVRCTWVKFNAIGSNGRFKSSTVSNSLFLSGSAVIAGNTSAVNMPPQATVAVSWVTEYARGRGHAGRIFAPRPSVVIQDDGKINSNNVTSMATAYSAFVTRLNNVEGSDFSNVKVVVASGINGAKNRVIGVRVGDVIDTQRRRRNNLKENYVAKPVA